MTQVSKKWAATCLMFLVTMFVWAENPHKYSETLYMWGEPDERDVDNMMQKFKDKVSYYVVPNGVVYTLHNDQYSLRAELGGYIYQTDIIVTVDWNENAISIEARAYGTRYREEYPFIFTLYLGAATPEIRNYNSFYECTSLSGGINRWLAQVLNR